MAVIKANAYGHGLLPVARTLAGAGVDSLAVARINEAIQLRENGIECPIVLLQGFWNADELVLASQHRFQSVIHCEEQISLLEQYTNAKADVWLKLDSGMHRLGFDPWHFRDAYRRLNRSGSLDGAPGLMSHFSSAGSANPDVSAKQLQVFLETVGDLPGRRSLANSAGVYSVPESRLDWVRPGLALYGVSALPEKSAESMGLRPVMRLSTRLVACKPIAAGETVGYGCRWMTKSATRLGVAACGYGDGYPWSLPDGAPVLVNGQRAVVAGQVSMDMIAIDLGDDSEAQVGDEVVLWGEPGLLVEEVAAAAGTIPYELLCRVTPRVSREII